MKLIYLASPFSHKDKNIEESRFKDITLIAALLEKKYGYAMFLPITQSYAMVKMVPSLGGEFKSWEKIDLFMVGKSDELWVVKLEGWENSKGVKAEIKHANKIVIPIKYIHYNNNEIIIGDK